MDMKQKGRGSPWVTLLLLLAGGGAFTGLALAVTGSAGPGPAGDPLVFLMNALPVWLLLGLLWLITGRAWLAALVTGSAVFLLSAGCFFKLRFRGDPVVWRDLFLLQEAGQMAGAYEILFTPLMYAFLAVVLGTVLLLFLLGKGRPGVRVRLLSLLPVGMAALFLYGVCLQEGLYETLAGEEARTETEAYLACGVVYPFLHSCGAGDEGAAGYDRAAAEEILSRYRDEDIPEEKKVSIVVIQLEAYTDFSLYDIRGISPEVYQTFHQVQAESCTGTLVTDIFAGNTAESEWAVLTGGNRHDDFSVRTNSVAWYLKDQGYVTGGGHPSHAWFYDRETVNENLGLDNYLFMENYYSRYAEGDVAYDDVFFPDLEKRLTEHFETSDAPLFSFNVTYQGHGPYNLEYTYWGSSYCTGDYPDHISNALNHYLYLMQDTGNRLGELTDFLESREEPVVLVLYGDHKPWMGDNGSIYEELGISLDTSTEEGFLNYYATWYSIWGNPAAKEALGTDLSGRGPDLSPCFLMDYVFTLCGWEGSAYMQAQRETAQTLPVLHTTGWVLEDGVYTMEPSPEARERMEGFQQLSLYDRTRFR